MKAHLHLLGFITALVIVFVVGFVVAKSLVDSSMMETGNSPVPHTAGSHMPPDAGVSTSSR